MMRTRAVLKRLELHTQHPLAVRAVTVRAEGRFTGHGVSDETAEARALHVRYYPSESERLLLPVISTE